MWERRSVPSAATDHRFAEARSVSAAPGPGVSEANSSRSPYQAIRSFEARMSSSSGSQERAACASAGASSGTSSRESHSFTAVPPW